VQKPFPGAGTVIAHALWHMVIIKLLFRFTMVSIFVSIFTVKFLVTLIVRKLFFLLTGRVIANTGPVQVRRLFERLQYTYIKLGQIMAMRHDFLPREYCLELMKLLDQSPPFKDEKALEIIEKELGARIDELFETFDPDHIASASFGQVYRAALPSGEKVVVKVLRPGIRPIVYLELAILKLLCRLLDFSCILGTFKVTPFIADFVVYTKEELDYLQEARYIRKIRGSNVENPLEKIPRVYPRYTTSKVLTLEFLDGVWMNEILQAVGSGDGEKLEEFNARGIDLPTVARNLMINSMIQAFEKTYYHADPHAANICIMENNVIGYVDFGIVGKMDRKFRDITQRYLQAFFKGDIDAAYSAFLEILQPPENIDLTGFEKEMTDLMSNWLEDVADPGAPLSDRSALRRMFREGKIMRKYGLTFPTVTSRFYRLLMISDVIILQLDPTLNVVEISSLYLKKLAIKDWKEKILSQGSAEIFMEYLYLFASLPKRINRILSESETIMKGSGKAISRLKRIPSLVAGFFGKVALLFSLAGFGLRLVFNVDFSYRLFGGTSDLTDTSLYLFTGAVLLIWLSRYLISKR